MNINEKQRNRLLAAAEIIDKGDVAVLEKLLEFQDFFEANKDLLYTKSDELEQSISKKLSDLAAIFSVEIGNLKKSLETMDEKTDKAESKRLSDQIQKSIASLGDKMKALSSQLKDEISTVKSLIPELPEMPKPLDLSSINDKMREHENSIAGLISLKDLNSMKEDLRVELYEEFKKINNLEKQKHYAEGLLGKSLSNLTDVNVAGITSGQTIKWNGNQWVIAAGGGFTTLAATETPNGILTVFTFSTATAKPSFIISDNVLMRATTSLGTVNWTWNAGTKQATMAIPPTDDILGVV